MGEQQNVARLLRFVALFVGVPTISIGLVLYLFDPKAHALHMVGFLILGGAAIVVFAVAPRLASRWVPEA